MYFEKLKEFFLENKDEFGKYFANNDLIEAIEGLKGYDIPIELTKELYWKKGAKKKFRDAIQGRIFNPTDDGVYEDRVLFGISQVAAVWRFKHHFRSFLTLKKKFQGAPLVSSEESLEKAVKLLETEYRKAEAFASTINNMTVSIYSEFEADEKGRWVGEEPWYSKMYEKEVFYFVVTIKDPQIRYMGGEKLITTIPLKGTLIYTKPIPMLSLAQIQLKGISQYSSASYEKVTWYPDGGHRHTFPFLNTHPLMINTAGRPCLGSFGTPITESFHKLDLMSATYHIMDWATIYLAGATNPYFGIASCFTGIPKDIPEELWKIEGIGNGCTDRSNINPDCPHYCDKVECLKRDDCRLYNDIDAAPRPTTLDISSRLRYDEILNPKKGIKKTIKDIETTKEQDDLLDFVDKYLYDLDDFIASTTDTSTTVRYDPDVTVRPF